MEKYAVKNSLGNGYWDDNDKKFYDASKFEASFYDKKDAESIRLMLIDDLSEESERNHNAISRSDWEEHIILEEHE